MSYYVQYNIMYVTDYDIIYKYIMYHNTVCDVLRNIPILLFKKIAY